MDLQEPVERNHLFQLIIFGSYLSYTIPSNHAMTGRLWRVVGGSGGGLLVRESHELTSTEVVERLATQSIVEELEAENFPRKIPGGFGIPNLTKQKTGELDF